MKVQITPADLRACNEALSNLAAARQWASILQAGGVDVQDELDQISANERIAQGMLTAMERIQNEPL